VGIEPPEIYAFKHDYVDLLPDDLAEIRERTASVWLLDEFLLRSPEFNHLRIVNIERLKNSSGAPGARHLKFHPHCHQRAEGPSPDGLPSGANATVELLRSCGYEVDLMDTGCCGMAGTFGYEAEHYELSMKVAELKLFPQVRALSVEKSEFVRDQSRVPNPQSSIVSASGAACRMQIRQGTGVEAIHPIMLVADFVKHATS
jgi:Fe-S oxidoreductase